MPVLASIALLGIVLAQKHDVITPGDTKNGYLLPNGWRLTPAGRQVDLGGLPLRLIAVPGKPFLIATSNGYPIISWL